jgi:membrane-bound inhibitor of C-type lysozyme
MLMPDAQRVTLYQVPVASGVRYSNGVIELRGKVAELQIVREGVATGLKDCEPYTAPAAR